MFQIYRCWHTEYPELEIITLLTMYILLKLNFFFTIDNVWWIKHGAYVNLKKIFLKYFLSIRELDELNKRLEVILICCWFCFSVFFLFIPSYRNLLSIIVTSWTPVPCHCVIFWTYCTVYSVCEKNDRTVPWVCLFSNFSFFHKHIVY